MAMTKFAHISGKWGYDEGVTPTLFEHYTRTYKKPNGPAGGYFSRVTLPVPSWRDSYVSPGQTRPHGRRDIPTSHYRLAIDVLEHTPLIYDRLGGRTDTAHYGRMSMSTGPSFIAGKTGDILSVDGNGFWVMADQNLINSCQTEALQHFKTGKLSLGASIAESRETAEYIVDKASAVLGMVRAAKSGRYRHVRQAFRRLIGFNDIRGRPLTALSHKDFKNLDRRARAWASANGITDMATARWLEYRYAILPVVYDLEAGFETFIDGIKTQNDSEQPWLVYAYGKQVHRYNHNQIDYYNTYISEGLANYKCKLWAKVDNVELAGTAQVGLSLTQAVWEIIPFSFVLDWAVGIGDFLEALDATRGLTFHSGFLRIMSGKNGDEVKFRYKTTDDVFYGNKYPWITGEVRFYTRRELSSFPVPSVVIKNPVSPKNIMSAFSLLYQIFAKKRLPGYAVTG